MIFSKARMNVGAKICLLLSLVGLTVAIPSGFTLSLTTAAITFTQPDGTSDFVGDGDDYATRIWRDPWVFTHFPSLSVPRDLANFGVVDGSIGGEISDTNGDGVRDPYFFLLFPGMPSAINLNTGQQHPIDARKYDRAAFRLCAYGESTPKVILYWYNTTTGQPLAGSSGLIPLDAGCGVYTFDLSTVDEWQGDINGLRFDLESFVDGASFSLDWFRLTESDDWSNTFPIQWNGLDPTDSTLELFLDQDASGYDGFMIAQISNAPASGTFNWGSADAGYPLPQDVQAGDYYVYAEVGGQTAGYSAAPLSVSQTPLIDFTDPSYTSGRDYATDNGNPWDMNSNSDGAVMNCTSYQFSGGRLDAYNTGNDPYIEFNTPVPIDTSFYRYFTIDFYSQYSFFTQGGGMSRVYWMNGSTTTTDDMIIPVGMEWRTYTLDLSQVPIEGGGQSTWEDSNWQTFRFDPNENTAGVSWRWLISDAKLTGPPEADEAFIVYWEIDNPESEQVEVTLSYDSDNAGFDGTPIGNAPASAAASSARHVPARVPDGGVEDYYIYLPLVSRLHCTGDCLAWDTSSLPSGNEYFIYACLDDGVNQICQYSDVPVLIRH